jgi:uncharacterized protein DUF87
MEMAKLLIGKEQGQENFYLPDEMIARTLAIIGQRGSGKSSTATVIAEEFCKASLPWMALDPVGVWWGLRAKADGSSGGFPVVVFGGERGDLPLEKGQGRKIAEACVAANVFAVIDLSRDSKTTWRTIVRDFCHVLQELRPAEPRHVFLEEAPEFVPQRASHQLGAECKEIVERLVRLGRNWGYGATVLTQRPATVDKDVLSQCESLFVMRTSGAHDRRALREWMEAHQTDQHEAALDSLASLPDGTGWLWSPQWLKLFAKIAVRRRETFHPGATRTVGGKARSVELVDVATFVAKVRKELTKVQAVVPDLSTKPGKVNQVPKRTVLMPDYTQEQAARQIHEASAKIADLENQVAGLRDSLGTQQRIASDAERRLAIVREHLKPQFDALAALFREIGEESRAIGGTPSEAWVPWLEKAGKIGARKLLEILIKHGRLKQVQLATLSGYSMKGGHWRKCRAFITKNDLATLEGEDIIARQM